MDCIVFKLLGDAFCCIIEGDAIPGRIADGVIILGPLGVC